MHIECSKMELIKTCQPEAGLVQYNMVPTDPAKSWKIMKKFSPVEVQKLAIGPEKGLIFG